MKLSSQPAFPQAFLREFYDDGKPCIELVTSDGMTIRQYAAIEMAKGIMSSDILMKQIDRPIKDVDAHELIAIMSCQMADSLIVELENTEVKS